MTPRPINWLKQLGLPAGVALVDLCWIYPWSLLAGQWLQANREAPLLAAPSILGLLLISQLLMRFGVQRHWPLLWLRLALAGTGLFAVLLLISLAYFGQVLGEGVGALPTIGTGLVDSILTASAPAVAFGLGLLLWGRGISHARDEIDAEAAARTFRQGTIGLILALIAIAITEPAASPQLLAQSSVYALGFIFVGLATLSLARLEEVRARSRARTGSTATFSRTWLAALSSLLLGLFLLTLGLAGAISVDLAKSLISPIFDLLGDVAGFIITIVALPLALAVDYLVTLAQRFRRPEQPRPPESAGQPLPSELLEPGRITVPEEIMLIIQWGLVAAVLITALVMLARAIFWSPPRPENDGVDEERESVTDWASLRAALLAWLHARFGQRDQPATAPVTVPEIPPLAEPPQTLSLRQLYQQILRLGASAGASRARSTTPSEHLAPLQARLEPDDDLAWMTDAYIRARYGPEPPAEAEVVEARLRWQRIQAANRTPGTTPRPPPSDQ